MFYGNEASINVTAPNIFVGDLGLNGSIGNPVYAKTDASGAVTEGSAEDYNIKWDGETLTLRNATIKSYTDLMGVKAAVRTTDIRYLTIELEGEHSGYYSRRRQCCLCRTVYDSGKRYHPYRWRQREQHLL